MNPCFISQKVGGGGGGGEMGEKQVRVGTWVRWDWRRGGERRRWEERTRRRWKELGREVERECASVSENES